MLPKKFLFVAIGLTLVLAGCETAPPYSYQYNPAYTAYVEGSLANPPAKAPAIVRQAIAAGNELIGKPYRYGGGHRTFYDNAYDCSGAVSYVLHAIGRLETPTPSQVFSRIWRPRRWAVGHDLRRQGARFSSDRRATF